MVVVLGCYKRKMLEKKLKLSPLYLKFLKLSGTSELLQHASK